MKADIVGISEIADRLGVKRQTVDMWRSTGQLPAPDYSVSNRPAWDWATVARWRAATMKKGPTLREVRQQASQKPSPSST